ncbi:hypothetical protein STSO111631_06800 [Stackebrandtia soli]
MTGIVLLVFTGVALITLIYLASKTFFSRQH